MEKKRFHTYILVSMLIHVTSISFLMTIKTEPMKEPRVAFVELVDIPRATEIEKAFPGLIESKKIKAKKPLPEIKEPILQGKVPDLPVKPDLPPEKSFPRDVPKVTAEAKKDAEKGEKKGEEEKRADTPVPREDGKEEKGGKIPSVKDLTPTLGRMVLAAKERKTKGKDEGEGENVGTTAKAKKRGEFSEIARGGTVLTPLDNPSIQYISYFASIKRKIELVWQYPFDAIQNGIQGELILDFSIARSGNLNNIKLVRSSGFSILDDEAIQSIKKAAPFSPIPDQYSIDELNIRANFIYEMHFIKLK
jgi:protein TonB